MRAEMGAQAGGQAGHDQGDAIARHVPPPQDLAPARFGFTATKKLGNAVTRNRIRRRLKEVVRLVAPGRAVAGCDYVLIAREAAATRSFATLERDLAAALSALHAPAESGSRPHRGERRSDTRGGTRNPSTRGRAGRPGPATEG